MHLIINIKTRYQKITSKTCRSICSNSEILVSGVRSCWVLSEWGKPTQRQLSGDVCPVTSCLICTLCFSLVIAYSEKTQVLTLNHHFKQTSGIMPILQNILMEKGWDKNTRVTTPCRVSPHLDHFSLRGITSLILSLLPSYFCCGRYIHYLQNVYSSYPSNIRGTNVSNS